MFCKWNFFLLWLRDGRIKRCLGKVRVLEYEVFQKCSQRYRWVVQCKGLGLMVEVFDCRLGFDFVYYIVVFFYFVDREFEDLIGCCLLVKVEIFWKMIFDFFVLVVFSNCYLFRYLFMNFKQIYIFQNLWYCFFVEVGVLLNKVFMVQCLCFVVF